MALIFCYECGSQISDKAVSCPKCGAPMPVKKEEEKLEDTTKTYHYSPYSYDYDDDDDDELSFAYKLISFLIWPVGILVWLMKRESEPESAECALKCSIYGLVTGVILSFLLMLS